MEPAPCYIIRIACTLGANNPVFWTATNVTTHLRGSSLFFFFSKYRCQASTWVGFHGRPRAHPQPPGSQQLMACNFCASNTVQIRCTELWAFPAIHIVWHTTSGSLFFESFTDFTASVAGFRVSPTMAKWCLWLHVSAAVSDSSCIYPWLCFSQAMSQTHVMTTLSYHQLNSKMKYAWLHTTTSCIELNQHPLSIKNHISS